MMHSPGIASSASAAGLSPWVGRAYPEFRPVDGGSAEEGVQVPQLGAVWAQSAFAFGYFGGAAVEEPTPPVGMVWPQARMLAGGPAVYSSSLISWTVFPVFPSIEIRDDVRHLITDRVRDVLARIESIVRRESRADYVPVERFVVRKFVDPESADVDVVITLWVSVPFGEAQLFWERLGVEVERLADSSSPAYAEIVRDRLSLEVESLVGATGTAI